MNKILILTNDKALEKVQGNVDIHTVNYIEFKNFIKIIKKNNTVFITYDNFLSEYIKRCLDIDYDIEYRNLNIKKGDIIIGCHNDNDTTYTIFVKE